MTIRASTGLRNKLLDTNPFRTIFNLGFIKCYDGPVPATADAVLDAANHLLLTISNNSTGTGLTFASSAASGAITKTLAETWSGVCGTSGTGTFYRLVAVGDTGAASTSEARLQGTLGTSGADLNMTTVTFVATTTYGLDSYSVTLPTL